MTPREAVHALLKKGFTESGIARALESEGVSCNQSTIHRIKTGEIPDTKYSIGVALIDLAKRRFAA